MVKNRLLFSQRQAPLQMFNEVVNMPLPILIVFTTLQIPNSHYEKKKNLKQARIYLF